MIHRGNLCRTAGGHRGEQIDGCASNRADGRDDRTRVVASPTAHGASQPWEQLTRQPFGTPAQTLLTIGGLQLHLRASRPTGEPARKGRDAVRRFGRGSYRSVNYCSMSNLAAFIESYSVGLWSTNGGATRLREDLACAPGVRQRAQQPIDGAAPRDDPHVWASALFDEVVVLGWLFVSELRPPAAPGWVAAALRGVCGREGP